MRILHLTASVGRHSGGLGKVALGFAKEQRLLGHKTAIWCLDSPEEASAAAREAKFDGAITTSPVVGPLGVGFSPAAERMARSSAGHRFEIMHQHGIWVANSRVANKWRTATRHPTIVSPAGTLEDWALKRSWIKKRLALIGYEQKNLREASCLHATCTAEAASCRRFGLENTIAVIPVGIEAEWLDTAGDGLRFRQMYSIPNDKRVMLFLARVHPKKGLPLLLESLAHLRGQLADWVLVVAGGEEVGHRRELEVKIRELGLVGMVQFVGPVHGATKRDAFAAAELYVLPTHSDNFAITVAEALGAGVPVLTTHGAPWEELIVERCGWWVPIDAPALGDALQAAAKCTRGELSAMGERGKALVARKYTWPRVSTMTIELYDWLLGRAPQPSFVIPAGTTIEPPA